MAVPTIEKRGWWGYEAIKHHQRTKGYDFVDILSESTIAEVLSDILHHADNEGFDAEKLLLKALKYYQENKEDAWD